MIPSDPRNLCRIQVPLWRPIHNFKGFKEGEEALRSNLSLQKPAAQSCRKKKERGKKKKRLKSNTWGSLPSDLHGHCFTEKERPPLCSSKRTGWVVSWSLISLMTNIDSEERLRWSFSTNQFYKSILHIRAVGTDKCRSIDVNLCVTSWQAGKWV